MPEDLPYSPDKIRLAFGCHVQVQRASNEKVPNYRGYYWGLNPMANQRVQLDIIILMVTINTGRCKILLIKNFFIVMVVDTFSMLSPSTEYLRQCGTQRH